MDRKISRQARKELVAALRERYREEPKKEKGKILDQFAAVSGCHRKHAVRLLGAPSQVEARHFPPSRRVYDAAVVEALTVLWEAADRICGKRLRAVLPDLLRAMEGHGHLNLDPLVRERLLSVSAATIDRLLVNHRRAARGQRKRRRSRKRAGKEVRVRTFADWVDPAPGYLEVDFVAHSGGSMAGVFIHSLVATDVSSGWTEAVPLLAREQSLVVEGLNVIRRQLPVPVLGIDTDNDSAFINDTLIEYCRQNRLEFTRSRPYTKNDQAWIEQKNGAVVRRFVGHDRFTGTVAGQALAQLYGFMRLYVNYFQPSFKLKEKVREGAKVKKLYHAPATPCDRLRAHDGVNEAAKDRLLAQRGLLDPLERRIG